MKGLIVTENFYATKVLPEVVKNHKAVCPHTGNHGIQLLHDNAPTQKSAMVTEYQEVHSIKTMSHPA